MTDIALNEEFVEEYFRDARERHAIYLRRTAGQAKPWTSDPLMQRYSITNVFRELDKTTVHLATHVRDPLRDHPLVLPAVALYRWFTLINTGNTLFNQASLLTAASPVGGAYARPEATLAGGYARGATLPAALAPGDLTAPGTPWQRWLETEDIRELEWALRKQGSPWCTGAFMIRSPIGMDKLEGVLSSFRDFWHGKPKMKTMLGGYVSMGWREVAEYVMIARETENPVPLRDVHEWLMNFYGLGGFLANEIISDLRYTFIGDKAPDEGTFNYPGPGAMRGAYLMLHGVKQGRKDRLEKANVKEVEYVSSTLRELSRDPAFWPQLSGDPAEGWLLMTDHAGLEEWLQPRATNTVTWPAWGGREPGMWLCEFVKLKRTRLGIGRPRGNYE